MRPIWPEPITPAIALLFAVTLFSWRIGQPGGGRAATTAIILLAAFKIHIVMQDFIAIRHAPVVLRLFCLLWVMILAALLILLQTMAPESAA